ncbi:DUF4097 family beta strand repeat-containing protein [Kribbella jejuensis]|uniref:DUF4097 family beta strand repeat-containing protein n=1 Tax=Kribbella jejuensis TaxID=236068 RepID=UPI001154E383|nr:DUF4097 family beta strand repeat-containing protein [Kribbella jejuensis]
MADEVEDVIEQARQKLVEIVRMMMRFMDRQSRDDSRFFRGLVDRQAPGLTRLIDQGRSTPEASRTLGEFLRPGWEGNLTEAFGQIRGDHPVFQDPAVRQATNEYLALRPQLAQRAEQMVTELQQLGAPEAAANLQRQTQQATTRLPAAAPPAQQLPPRPAQAPTPPRPVQAPTAPRPVQAPSATGPAQALGPQTQAPQARAGQMPPTGPGAQPTPPATRAPGPSGPATAPQSPTPGAGQTPGPAPTPPRTQAPGVGQVPASGSPASRAQAPGVGQAPAAGPAPSVTRTTGVGGRAASPQQPIPGTGQPAGVPTPPRTQAPGVGQVSAGGAPASGAQAPGVNQAPGVGDAQPGAGQVGTTRTIAAGVGGPVKLDAGLLGAAGRVVVRADPNCTEARITIRTADQTGPAADAVRGATLESSPDGRMTASAQQTQPGVAFVQNGPQPGAGNIVGDGYVTHNGNVVSSYYTNSPNGFSVVSQSGNGAVITGSVNNVSFDNGRIQIGSISGGAFSIGPQTSPIEIEAIVPEGSSVECSTDSANIETHGRVDVVEANTASGNVSVDQANAVTADTASGQVRVQNANQVQANTASGAVSVGNATEVRANTASGAVSVGDATEVRANSASGAVSVRNAETVRATTASGAVRVDSSKDVSARTASGAITVGNADKAVVRSHSGSVNIGTTKDATARSQDGDVTIRDVRGSARANSGTGAVSVHATEGGTVKASSTLRPVTVTATDKAVGDGLTVNAEGPAGQVRTPEGANTGTAAAAGSTGARDFNDTSRADRARDTGAGRG